MKMIGAKVQLKSAQRAMQLLSNKGLKDKNHLIVKKDGFMFIPLTADPQSLKAPKGQTKMPFEIVSMEFPPASKKPSLKEILKNRIPEDKLAEIVRSYDIIGSIIIIEIPREQKKFEKEIAKALLATHNNIETVAKKVGGHIGELRIQKTKIIAGRKSMTTTYKENNVTLRLNINKTYFSPRLANERKRIAGLVKPGEDVLVMFSGIGPYPLVIARNSQARLIAGVELNKEAHCFAVENARINKAENIELHHGDARKIVPRLGRKFDRIIMPLPKTGETFLDVALKQIKKGGVVHFYDFEKEEDIPKKCIKKVMDACKSAKLKCRILRVVRCGQSAPRQYRVCTDFSVS